MGFRLVPKSVTLNDTERRNGVILRCFREFGYLPGALRKSSRSLSHLLMSSCSEYVILVRGHISSTVCAKSRLDVRKYFFCHRIVHWWNSLQAKPDDFSSLNKFKRNERILVACFISCIDTGPDDVPAELFKAGGETGLDRMHRICVAIWETGEWPEEWTFSTFIPLPKKGDLKQCENYRTIALVSHASKILLRIILERIRVKTETEIADEQPGFRQGRGLETRSRIQEY